MEMELVGERRLVRFNLCKAGHPDWEQSKIIVSSISVCTFGLVHVFDIGRFGFSQGVRMNQIAFREVFV